MGFLAEQCIFTSLTRDTVDECNPFSCGDVDLDDFFANDAPLYRKQLLGKSYCFRLASDMREIVCAFTVSNDSLRTEGLPNSREKKVRSLIPFVKQAHRYPAVLIGRIGVNVKFSSKGVGSELMDFIKDWFVDEQNKTGCRFVIVDAYNEERTLNFYSRNGFEFLFSSEMQEAEILHKPTDEKLRTRLMTFDLIKCLA